SQVVRMDHRAVRLSRCFRSHRTQQRQAAVDVVVRESSENLGCALIGSPLCGRIAQRGNTGEERYGVVDFLASERRVVNLDQLAGDGQGLNYDFGSERALDGE